MRRNTYLFGKPLTDPTGIAYVQDTAAVEEITNGLLSGKYYSIMGPPLVGKTTLLHDVLRTLGLKENRCLPVYVSFGELQIQDEASLCTKVIEKIADKTQLPSISAGPCELAQLRPFLLSLVKGKSVRVILAFDHLEDLPPPVLHRLVRFARILYGQRSVDDEFGKISIVLCGSLNLYDLPIGPGSPYNISELFWMKDWAPEEVRKLIFVGAELAGIKFSKGAVEHIVSATEGDRYFVQRICAMCLQNREVQTTGKVSFRLASDNIHRLVALHYLDDVCLGRLVKNLYGTDPELLSGILALVEDQPGHPTLSRLEMDKGRLIGIIQVQQKDFRIRNNIYKQYLARHLELIRRGLEIHTQQARSSKRLLELQQVSLEVASAFDSDQALTRALDKLRQATEAIDVAMFSYDPVQEEFKAMASNSQGRWHSGEILKDNWAAKTAIAQSMPLVCHEGTEYCKNPDCAFRWKPQSCTCNWLPLALGGNPLGVIQIVNAGLHIAGADEKQAMMIVAAQFATALGNARFIKVLNAIGSLEITSAQPDQVMKQIVAETQSLLSVPAVNLWKFDTPTHQFRIIESIGLSDKYKERFRLSLDSPETAEFFGKKNPLLLKNLETAKQFRESDKPAYRDMGLTSLLSMPLMLGTEPIGILEAATHREWHPSQWEKDIFRILGNQVAAAISNADSVAELRELANERENYIKVLRHQLSSAPSIALNHLQNLLDGKLGELNPDQQDRLKTARYELKLLKDSIEKLRLMGRFKAGKVKIEKKKERVYQLVNSAVKTHRARMHSKSLRLRLHNRLRHQMVSVDPSNLFIIIDNLLDNAIKYTPPGGTISVGVKIAKGNLIIVVEDTGIGVESKDHQKIFEEYYQVAPTSPEAEGGIGSGLYIAKMLTKMHGGDIAVVSEKDQGARFTVTIPI